MGSRKKLPNFPLEGALQEVWECGQPLQGRCPTLVHRADTREHPCTRTHAYRVGAAATVELSFPPHLPQHCKQGQDQGDCSPESPHTQSDPVSPSWDTGNHRFVGGKKPHSIAHMSHSPLAGGLALLSQGHASSRDTAGHFERRWVYNHRSSWRLSWLPALPTRSVRCSQPTPWRLSVLGQGF